MADRMIVTVGAPFLPDSWLDALASDGVVVVNLEGSLTKTMARFRRSGANTFNADLPEMAQVGFTPLALSARPLRVDSRQLFALPVHDWPETIGVEAVALLRREHRGFLMLLQALHPEWRVTRTTQSRTQGPVAPDELTTTVVDDAVSSALSLSKGQPPEIRGTSSVAALLEHAYRLWRELGAPEVSDYTLTYTTARDTRTMMLETGSRQIPTTMFLP